MADHGTHRRQDGTPLTPAETEAVAVLVQSMRRGWGVTVYAQDTVHQGATAISVPQTRSGKVNHYHAPTAAEAYEAALEGEGIGL